MAGSILGRGWKFPVSVDKRTGRIKMVEHEEDVKEAIRIIIATSKGERVMRPDYGSTVRSYVFDVLDTTTLTMMEESIRDAILKWEARVADVSVTAKIDDYNPGRVNLDIQYRIAATNSVGNLIYPFYVNDGGKSI